MRTIPYSQIEKGLAAIAGIDSENILAHEKAQFAEFINDATRFVWDYYPWPESTRIEKRYFRPLWVEGQNYEIGDEVFFKDKYYRKFKQPEFKDTQGWGQAGFNRIFAFGNSYTDSGNYPDQYWQDKETTWVKYLAESLSLPLSPSSNGGTNYAYGGARLVTDHYDSVADITIPSIQSQINSAPDFSETDLVTFFGGGNDYIGDNKSATYIASNIESNLNLLISKGAKNISILNVFNLYRLPAVSDPNADQVSQDINTSLAQSVATLTANNPDVKITIYDFYDFIERMYLSLSEASFQDIFYDDLHMKEGIHSDIAYEVYDQIQGRDWDSVENDWFPYVNPQDSNVWHETGDRFTTEEWLETGLYGVGALVQSEDGVFICIRIPEGDPLDPSTQYANFSQNGIALDNGRYWQKVDTTFERFIAFDQEDEEVIGTLFSIHTADPRYNSGPVLDWELGREGIYVDLPFETNHVWVRYREEPPVFSPQDSDKPLLNYLAPAIKAYAYRSFLISDGQNEKAALQEQLGLDMLVREIDKLVHQHDRGIKGFKGVAI